jgi:AcrR family transcriptional regulator
MHDGTEKVMIDKRTNSRRLSKDERRLQLLETARLIVREEGVDCLTLGHLAIRAGISKPVVYDHFGTRSDLLIELYKWIDLEQINAFRDTMAESKRSSTETVEALANAYIHCAADMNGEVHAVGGALAGSKEKAAVFQELLDNSARMFVSVLEPYSTVSRQRLEYLCIGLVGAGEALAAAVMRGKCRDAEAIDAFTLLIKSAIQ